MACLPPYTSIAAARALSISIRIQNIPEGLAVATLLRAEGMSIWNAFWYGQLSTIVEPIAAMIVTSAAPMLPSALSFSTDAMICIVVEELIPWRLFCNHKDSPLLVETGKSVSGGS